MIICRMFHWMFGGWTYKGRGLVDELILARCIFCNRCYKREINHMLQTDTNYLYLGWDKSKLICEQLEKEANVP